MPSNYTYFILKEGKKVLVNRTLGHYEGLLSEQGFLRIHQSHIVNLKHVEGFLKIDGGKVQMIDQTQLPLSRNRKPSFLKRFI